jgi:hypothetical protein
VAIGLLAKDHQGQRLPDTPLEAAHFVQIPARSWKELRRNLAATMFFVAF